MDMLLYAILNKKIKNSGGGTVDLSDYAKKEDLVGLKSPDGGEIFNNYENNVAIGNYSHAEGYQTKAIKNSSHAEGSGTKSSGDYSHAEGVGTTALGESSHAEGNSSSALPKTINTSTSNNDIISIWDSAQTKFSLAKGKSSHVEGSDNLALANYSHSEGLYTIASAYYSHAEGLRTKATSSCAHAEGGLTKAEGLYSHSEGHGTIAYSKNQHVQGSYNIEDTNGKYAFIIGNGEDDSNRSNAFAIDWNGLIYLNNSDVGIDLSNLTTKEEVAQTTEKVAQLDSSVSSLNRKTIKFRHGKGTFNATASGTNIVWKYGSQEIQGESCTFDVKSDNGLIVIEFDEITKISISNDSLNKLCLSDLGGNITTYLGLNGCSQITGDLSDLGGNITFFVNLSGCPKITGDLSDLGGNITFFVNLSNCSQITGDLSDLGGKITSFLGLNGCSQITGDLSDLGGNIITVLSLNGCSQITGDLSDLGGKITNSISLSGCSKITGVYSGTKYPTRFVVSNTAITANDMDQNLINFSNSTTKNGTFTATNMTRTAASDDAIAALVANGWTVSGLTKEG